METEKPQVVLPEWTQAQQDADRATLQAGTKATNVTRFEQADVVARVAPMSVQGKESGVANRVMKMADWSGKSANQIQVLRRVGCRWLPEHREATAKCVLDWSAIRSACTKTPAKGNDLDPVQVLVALCQMRETVSLSDYDAAYEAAVNASLPKIDAPKPPIASFDDLEGVGEPPIVSADPTPLDDLVADIDHAPGHVKATDKAAAKLAAAELLLWIAGADAVVEKLAAVIDLPVGLPVRAALVEFVAKLVKQTDIAQDEVYGASVFTAPWQKIGKLASQTAGPELEEFEQELIDDGVTLEEILDMRGPA